MARYKVSQRSCLIKNLLLLEGHTRAGKFLLGKILDGFKGIEHFQYFGIIEQLPFLHRLGAVSKEAAISLMQIAVDENAFHLKIGRNLNFRFNDHSSIQKVPGFERYIQRAFITDDKTAFEELKTTQSYSAFVTHELMSNIGIVHEAFPSMKAVSILRHPVDVVHSWWVRGWCQRETKDPLYFQSCVNVYGIDIPWFAYRWAKDYEKMPVIDRIIRSLISLEDMARLGYRSLSVSQKKRILFITHEGLIEDPWDAVKRMERFLKTKATSHMPTILKREGCFKTLPVAKRLEKIAVIKKKASQKQFSSLMKVAARYENCVKAKQLEKYYGQSF